MEYICYNNHTERNSCLKTSALELCMNHQLRTSTTYDDTQRPRVTVKSVVLDNIFVSFPENADAGRLDGQALGAVLP